MRLTPACSPLPSGGWALRARRGLTGGAQCGTGCTRGRKGRRDGWGLVGGSPVLSVLRWLCGSLLFARTCACLVLLTPFPISAAHFGSRVSITLCGFFHSGLARCPSHFFIRGPPWDTALSSKAAVEACVLHTGWNRSRVNSRQLQARRPYARSGL